MWIGLIQATNVIISHPLPQEPNNVYSPKNAGSVGYRLLVRHRASLCYKLGWNTRLWVDKYASRRDVTACKECEVMLMTEREDYHDWVDSA